MSNGNKIITRSNSKVMIRYGELPRILNATEIQQWNHIVAKIERFQNSELERGVQ
ncbi:hypothetical protein [Lysinibacillus fusiformis]|uniref:hypothetical protein n=1 Tax=Lysinibacillus fusiformis TaxID=28031 RepID=UPI0035C2398F|nr:hypothetical protein QYY55_16110 [Lysinibacillus fusiformis]